MTTDFHNSRREVLAGGLLTVLFGGCCATSAHAQPHGAGCWIPPEHAGAYLNQAGNSYTYQMGSEPIEPRSGNRALDRALAQSLATISREFGVLPGFAYYTEQGAPNARAMSEKRLDHADGTVLFGLKLLQLLLGRTRPDAAIIAVCAHEFGHIVSYKNGMIRQLDPTGGQQPFRAEQFADFMAGYFAGRRKLVHRDFPAAVFAATQNSFGGSSSHGSGQQRGAAVQEGFLTAYQKGLQGSNAIQAGFNYAMAQ